MPAWELTAPDGRGLTGPLAHEGQGNVPSSAFSWVQRIPGPGGVEEGGKALPLAATTPLGRQKLVLFGLRVETSSLSCQGIRAPRRLGVPGLKECLGFLSQTIGKAPWCWDGS